jgi:SAM-dependent methyltransferase
VNEEILSPALNKSSSALIAGMQAYYARRAPIYEASMGYDRPEFVRSLAPIITALCNAMRNRTVLEIACGPGFWTRHASEVARAIVATDYNESTLALARAKGLDPARVQFVRSDAYDLSSVAGSFTGAFAVDWLAHVPRSRLSVFLDQLHGRLAPGARVAFCDQTPGPSSITPLRDAEGNHLQERTLPDGSRYHVIKHFFSDDHWRDMLADCAEAIDIQRFTEQRRVVVSYTWKG